MGNLVDSHKAAYSKCQNPIPCQQRGHPTWSQPRGHPTWSQLLQLLLRHRHLQHPSHQPAQRHRVSHQRTQQDPKRPKKRWNRPGASKPPTQKKDEATPRPRPRPRTATTTTMTSMIVFCVHRRIFLARWGGHLYSFDPLPIVGEGSPCWCGASDAQRPQPHTVCWSAPQRGHPWYQSALLLASQIFRPWARAFSRLDREKKPTIRGFAASLKDVRHYANKQMTNQANT